MVSFRYCIKRFGIFKTTYRNVSSSIISGVTNVSVSPCAHEASIGPYPAVNEPVDTATSRCVFNILIQFTLMFFLCFLSLNYLLDYCLEKKHSSMSFQIISNLSA